MNSNQGKLAALFGLGCVVVHLSPVRDSGPYLEGASGFVHFGIGVLPAIFGWATLPVIGITQTATWPRRTALSVAFVAAWTWLAVLYSAGFAVSGSRWSVRDSPYWYKYATDAVRRDANLRVFGALVGLFVGFLVFVAVGRALDFAQELRKDVGTIREIRSKKRESAYRKYHRP